MNILNSVVKGDSVDVLRSMDNGCIDLVVTSPPYDNLRNYDGFEFDFKSIAKELFRVVKKGGVVVWVVGDAVLNGSETGSSFEQVLFFKELGFKLHDTMVYEKNGSSFPARRTGSRYSQIFEYMFVLSKGAPKTANLICDKANRWTGWQNWGKKSNRNPKTGELDIVKDMKPVPDFSPRNNIWRYSTGGVYSSTDKLARKHPAIFPEELAVDHIRTWSNKGDVVLDCFSGSGTTCKMAKSLGRDYIGIDISEKYVELSRQRIALAVEMTDDVLKPNKTDNKVSLIVNGKETTYEFTSEDLTSLLEVLKQNEKVSPKKQKK